MDEYKTHNDVVNSTEGIETGARTKVHEDALLRKIQQDNMRQAIDEVRTEDKNLGREQFEDRLLEKLMSGMSSGDNPYNHSFNQRSEMLMISSAVALTDEEKEAIVRKFIQKTNKHLRQITTVVDPSLITGVRLQSESFYYEISGQKTLRELRRHLDRTWQY